MARVKLLVTTPQGIAGQLSKEDSNFLFGRSSGDGLQVAMVSMQMRPPCNGRTQTACGKYTIIYSLKE